MMVNQRIISSYEANDMNLSSVSGEDLLWPCGRYTLAA